MGSWGHIFLLSSLDISQTNVCFSQLSAPGNAHLPFFPQFEMPVSAQQNLLYGLPEDVAPENGKNGAEQGFTSLNMYH